MKPLNPLISILISTRNHAAYLHQCLASLQRQIFKDFEVLVFDDGSSDETPELLREFTRDDRRFSFLREEQSAGCLYRFNQLFRLASGDLIWGVGSDDFCHDPYFLSKGVTGLQKYPDASGFFSSATALHMPLGVKGKIWGPGGPDRFISGNGIMQSFFANQETSPGPSCVLKSRFFRKEQALDLSLGPQSDYFVNNLAAGSSGIFFISNPCVTFRVWDDAASFSASQNISLTVRRFAILEIKLRNNLPAHYLNDPRWDIWRNRQLISLFNLSHKLHLKKSGLFGFILFKNKNKNLWLDIISMIDEYVASFNNDRLLTGGLLYDPIRNKDILYSLIASFCIEKVRGFFARVANSVTKRLVRSSYGDIKKSIIYVK